MGEAWICVLSDLLRDRVDLSVVSGHRPPAGLEVEIRGLAQHCLRLTVQLVPEAEIDGQIPADLPVILDEEVITPVDFAEQIAREAPVATGWVSGQVIREGIPGISSVEREGATRVCRIRGSEAELSQVRTEFESVRAFYPRNTIHDLIHVRRIYK